ncbi:hypothetical protein HNO88_000093 [Novosphingobium chloroacetimidivorans]|uniref:Uncharacterized protein n=1 Tax=Novosphingobium chloroacetimidivorans TaxID=1428314 RepID=A0A7W7K5Z6_9SPHN|nr:hypothetical protein [Novosphingobium chloroacetimidivorans]MBB4856796.1 hypothetical protein [Novosphingobium chloroacetimidivorans]
MSGGTIASLVAIGMALVLAWRGLSARAMPRAQIWKMALAWLAIIVVLVLVIQWLGLEVGR